MLFKSVQHSLFKINGQFYVCPENSLLVGNKATFEAGSYATVAIKMTELSDPVLHVKIF